MASTTPGGEAECAIRRLDAAEHAAPDLVALLARLDGRVTDDTWAWEYRRGPAPASVYEARLGDRLAGHYALVATPMRAGGKRVMAGKAEGSIIDRAVVDTLPPRRRRVFQSIVQRALADAQADGVEIVFGFPNAQAEPTQVKAGFAAARPSVGAMRRILRLGPFVQRSPRLAPLAGLAGLSARPWLARHRWSRASAAISDLRPAHQPALMALADRLGGLYPGAVFPEPSYDYLRWRFLENPYADGRVLVHAGADGAVDGLIALSLAGEPEGDPQAILRAHVQLALAVSQPVMSALVAAAVSVADAMGAAAIDAWRCEAPISQPLGAALRRHGFRARPAAPKRMILWGAHQDLGHWSLCRALKRW